MVVTETWRSVVGFEGLYEISNLGRLKSLRGRKPRIIVATPNPDGYLIVQLCNDGRKMMRLHRVVALAFHGDKQNALHNEVAHLDGNRANARADNLKWVSKVENRSHRKLHGTESSGERHYNSKLTEAAVRHIRSTRASRSNLAAQYQVTRWAIDDVRTRRNWKHVV